MLESPDRPVARQPACAAPQAGRHPRIILEGLMRIQMLAGLATALALLCGAAPATAQEQTARVEGTVRDEQGGALPGVAVEARNLTVGAALDVVTDGSGTFRFVALGPGLYDITASLDGFRPSRFERVEVLLGQIKRLDFTLSVGGVQEVVNVSAASPLVDVKQSSRGFSLRQDQLAYLPRGLDYTTVVPLLPGANAEPKLGGLSVDGSSAAENRFIIDGIDTTDAMFGLPGQTLNVDNVEEIQVKSSGFTAEYGGSTGGVVNVLTRSGTNAWHGDARFYFTGDTLNAGPRPTLRRTLQVSTEAEYVTYPEDPYHALEPGFSLGGPIKRDRAWFYVAYQPLLRHTERTVTFALDGSSGTFGEDVTRHLLTASQTLQLGPRLRTRASFNYAPTRTEGLLPNQAGTQSPVSNFDVTKSQPSWTVSGTADFVASSRLFVSGRVGYTVSDTHTDGVRDVPGYLFSTSNIGLLDVPPSLQRVTGFTTDTNNYDWVKDRVSRLATQVDATWFATGWGDHVIKAGVQADWTTNDVDKGMKRRVASLGWNRSLLRRRGPYGYYSVVTNSVDPQRGQIFIGEAEGSTAGLFVQDAWTIRHRLTLNVGLRTERETVPRYARPGGDTTPIIEFDFREKLAPRLGAAYDLRGDGRWKIYGSWGVFYDIFKYSASTAFGGVDTVQYAFTLDTYDWPTLLADPACPPACPGTLIIGPLTGANVPNDAVDPDLDPMKLQEAVVGVEHQLRPNLLVAARYVHKQLDRAVEDIGSQDASYNEIYTVGNPGFGRATIAYPGVVLPKAVRRYDAFEVAVRRPLANRWAFSLSYLWSRLYGNFSGLSQSDENGRVSPNVGRVYDYPVMMFDDSGQPVYGRLATDRPHQVKGYVVYSTAFGLNASVFQFVGSGLPVTREVSVLPPSNYPMQYLGRMSDGRTPALSQTDVYVQQDIAVGRGTRLSVGVSVANLFNQGTVTSKFVTETEAGAALAFDEADLYAGRLDFEQLFAEQGVRRDARFLMVNAYQAPRTVRVMVKWSF